MPRLSFHICFAFFFILNAVTKSSAQDNQFISGWSAPSHYSPEFVEEFYQLNHDKPFWYSSSRHATLLRNCLLQWLDRSTELGLNPADYHYPELLQFHNRNIVPSDSLLLKEADRLFTDAALTFCRDLYMGKNFPSLINSDEIFPLA